MNCLPCAERRQAIRDAWVNGQIAEAVRQTALGAAELVGAKPKDEKPKE